MKNINLLQVLLQRDSLRKMSIIQIHIKLISKRAILFKIIMELLLIIFKKQPITWKVIKILSTIISTMKYRWNKSLKEKVKMLLQLDIEDFKMSASLIKMRRQKGKSKSKRKKISLFLILAGKDQKCKLKQTFLKKLEIQLIKDLILVKGRNKNKISTFKTTTMKNMIKMFRYLRKTMLNLQKNLKIILFYPITEIANLKHFLKIEKIRVFQNTKKLKTQLILFPQMISWLLLMVEKNSSQKWSIILINLSRNHLIQFLARRNLHKLSRKATQNHHHFCFHLTTIQKMKISLPRLSF